MSYGQKYVLYFKSSKNQAGEVKIYKNNYTGSVTELIGMASPVKDNYKGENDEIETPIKCLNWTITILDPDVGTYDEFFTSDQRMFKVNILIDEIIVGVGWINTDNLQRPLFTIHEDLILMVNDGLSSLKNENFRQIDENYFNGYVTPLQVISACLYRTNLELGLKENIDFYEVNNNKDDHNSLLNQVYFQSRVFEDGGKYDSCYDVLRQILTRFNCELYQKNGYWVINRINQKKSQFLTRIYTYSSGSLVYNSTETINPVIKIDGTTCWFWDMPMLSLRPAWKKHIIKQDYGFDNNLMKNIPFVPVNSPYYAYNNGITIIDTRPQPLSIINHMTTKLPGVDQIMLFWKEEPFTWRCLKWNLGYFYADSDQFLKINFSAIVTGAFDVKIMVICNTETDRYYLKTDGNWVTTSEYVYSIGPPYIFPQVLSQELPGNGTLEARIFQQNNLSILDIVPRTITFEKNALQIELMVNGNFIKSIEHTTNINSNNVYVPDPVDLKIGDIPEEKNMRYVYEGALYLDNEGLEPTSKWVKKSEITKEKTLNGLLADEISVNHLNSQKVISGNLFVNADHSNSFEIDNELYIISNLTHDRYENEISGDLVKIGGSDSNFLKLKGDGYVKLKSGGKIKLTR